MFKRLRLVFLLTLAALALVADAHGSAASTDDGVALSLHGDNTLVLGRDLLLTGNAYAVQGLANLVPAPGARLHAVLEESLPRRRGYRQLSEAQTEAGAGGRFALSVAVPERTLASPRLRLSVRRGQGEAREYTFSFGQRHNIVIDALSDRHRYEPGETMHLFARVRSTDSGEVRRGLGVRVFVSRPDGSEMLRRDLTTSEAGVVTLDVPLPDGAVDGNYSARFAVTSPVSASSQLSMQVARRTVERLLVDVELEPGTYRPGQVVRGEVRVREPSGTPVRAAEVTVSVPHRDTLTLTTNAEGVAALRITAPSYVAGDTQNIPVAVRVAHPAFGTLTAGGSFLVSRVPYLVEATAENADLVPDVPSEIYLLVTRPDGSRAPAGVPVVVSGDSVPRGELRLATDEHGMVTVPTRLAAEDAGPTGGVSFATSLRVQLGEQGAVVATVTVPVARDAELRPRVGRTVVAPGDELEVQIARRASSARERVLLTLAGAGRVLGYTVVEGGRDRATLHVPAGVGGVVWVVARPLHDERYAVDPTHPGHTLMGVGASAAVLVRPDDAFTTELGSDRPIYSVGETAQLSLTRRPLPTDAGVDDGPRSRADRRREHRPAGSPSGRYAALVVRDLAAHGGETDFALTWLNTAIDLAQADPTSPGADRLLRASLAAAVGRDDRPQRPSPVDPAPWFTPRDGATSGRRGVLIDPIQAKESLLRDAVGQVMMTLEQTVAGFTGEREELRGVVVDRGGRRDFDPEVLQNLMRNGRLSRSTKNLGGQPMTLAMVESADRNFRFDTVARRVARRKLLKILLAVSALSDPETEAAARVANSEPPERWLSALLRLGLLQRADLFDPWGHAFVMRRATGRRPRLPVAASAPEMEVVSPGPDGRAGTGDDVRDPFARVVPLGSLYAAVSGEDAAMRSVSALAPGQDALEQMALAFDTLGLAAVEETLGDAVYAGASEGMAMGDMPAEIDQMAYGTMGMGAGGSGSGYARGVGGLAGRRARVPHIRAGAVEVMDEPAPTPSALARAGEHIRERFPATLFFLGELSLDELTTRVELPLADALTTYRVEAVTWTASGYTSNARLELSVRQDATVDAPVPHYASVGDELVVPLRVQNHTDQPLAVRMDLSAEGLEVGTPGPISVTIPAQDALARDVRVRLTAPGEGALVARVVRASDGSPLDAVRRPLTIYPEARLVRELRHLLFRGDTEVVFEVPADAVERGPARLDISAGESVFGPVDPAWEGWTWVLAALGRQDLGDGPRRASARLASRWRHGQPRMHIGTDDAALAVGLAYFDPEASDDLLRAALAAASDSLERHPSESGGALEARVIRRAKLLMLLAPAAARSDRPAIDEDLHRLVHGLAELVRARSVGLSERPLAMVHAAAALAMIGDPAADELLLRVRRMLVRYGDRAMLEPSASVGDPVAWMMPTALMAVAEAKRGDTDAAMLELRSLLRDADSVRRGALDMRALAAFAAGLVGGRVGDQVALSVDGRSVRLERVDGRYTAELAGLGRPGAHRLRLTLPAGTPALGTLAVRYARPWSGIPQREARLGLRLDGEVGARDTRAGLVLTLENASPRMLTEPIVEVDLPAGVELDEPTRARLAAFTQEAPSVEGRTLRLALRPVAPQSRVRVPLPLRFSVSGALRGLGVAAFDGGRLLEDGARPTTLLAPRTIQVAASGPPPEEAEAPPPPDPRPIPRPIDVLRRTTTRQEVSR